MNIDESSGSEYEFDDEGVPVGRAGTPVELVNAAEEASENLLPSKSKDRYLQAYNVFQQWKESNGATSNSERVLMAYFGGMVKKKSAASSMWSRYSMLKSTLKIYDKIDISTYYPLTQLLKKSSIGYRPKKAKTFTKNEVQQFMDEASDDGWLDVKVACIFGVCGACRSHEMPLVVMGDIKRHGDMFLVDIPETKVRKPRSFCITGKLFDIVQRYMALRPANVSTDRFFLNFQKGKCTIQTIGKNKFYKMPLRIATFLKLPDLKRYTGHSFRRSSASILINAGGTKTMLMLHGGWESEKTADSYVDESIFHKQQTANIIMSSINCTDPSTSASSSSSKTVAATTSVLQSEKNVTPLSSKVLNCDAHIDNQFNQFNVNAHREAPASNSYFDVVDSSAKTESSNLSQNFINTMNGSEDKENATEIVKDDKEIASQITSTFMQEVGKRFAFYKCDNLTINFNKQ